MTHGRPARLSAGTVNPQTLALTGLNQNFGNGGKWTMPFSEGGQGMMVHWNMASTGYSTFLLTNGGAGFTRADTVIFNQLLAEDAKRQLDSVWSANPSFTPSPRLARLRHRVDACFVRCQSAWKTYQGSGEISVEKLPPWRCATIRHFCRSNLG